MFKILNSKFLSSLLGIAVSAASLSAAASCITLDNTATLYDSDGYTLGLSARQALYPRHHFCYVSGGDFIHRHEVCDILDHLKVPQVNKKHDSIAIPHRGLWGPKRKSKTDKSEIPYDYTLTTYIKGPRMVAENTLDAVIEAFNADCKIVEVDVAMMGEIRNNKYSNTALEFAGDKWELFLGHYFRMHATTFPDSQVRDYRNTKGKPINNTFSLRPMNIPFSDIYRFKMRLRDQTKQSELKNSAGGYTELNPYTSFLSVVTRAKDSNAVLMVDPKVPDLKNTFQIKINQF